MAFLVLLGLIALASIPSTRAQSCPSGQLFSSVPDPSDESHTIDSCCAAPVEMTDAFNCILANSGSDWSLNCRTETTGASFIVKSGTAINSFRASVRGQNGGSVGQKSGGTAYTFTYGPYTPLGTLNRDLRLYSWVNVGGNVDYGNEEVGGGGGYSAFGDLDCALAHPSGVFPDNGVECRFIVGGGGGGASMYNIGARDSGSGRPGNSVLNVLPNSQPNSSGQLPYAPNGKAIGAGGGAGIRGGAGPRPPYVKDNTYGENLTGSGAGGLSSAIGSASLSPFRWSAISSAVNNDAPFVKFAMVFTSGIVCTPLSAVATMSETTYAATETVDETSYIETVYAPSATITEVPTRTVTRTPDVSTVTEEETEEVELPPTTITVPVDGGVTTPPTATVQASTDITYTPEPSTTTVTVTPEASTVYETSFATSTLPTSTFTTTTTIATGFAPCQTYRLSFPAACCPSAYVRLQPHSRRRAVPFGKRGVTYTVTVDGGTKTETNTVQATQTLGAGEATVTSATTTEVEAPTPLETVTTTTTITAPQLQVEEYTTFYDEAETPLVYETSTYSHEAATPVVTDTSYAPTPTTTVTVHSTTTLQQPVTTATATSTVQSTRCGSRNAAYSQAFCPLPIPAVVKLDQIAQVNLLNFYKGLNGKEPITVDCGSAGVFSY
ncbi:hypothetical protein JCM8547_007463 [Rhodosporidiobolus lusitaniae]